MKVQKINFTQPQLISLNANNTKPQERNIKDTIPSQNYNPIAYQDYNISFGERLFRTPANFYAQDFNKKNMPYSLKHYLDGDYEDRQNIPPAQMMKIVFNDINANGVNTLEDVKKLYPDEPLFENLHSMSKKKYREGILAEITLMHDDKKSLFKNGKDDLGMYILKKIYLEGKTLKEINKDFKKDVSKYYDGLSDIDYSTLAAFGIKFPKTSFWHSFIVTREDFPYVYKPRKEIESRIKPQKKELTLADINSGNFEIPPKRYNPKDHEIRKLADAVLKGHGSRSKTEREMKRSNIKENNENATFIQKYMSQIMSISLERVHASDEMRSFFEDYDNLDNATQNRMQKYWDASPEMKLLQSIVMSDTMKLFFDTYGADGQNEEFKDLLKYAESIKSEREEKLQIHNKIQSELEELPWMNDEEFEQYMGNLKTPETEISSDEKTQSAKEPEKAEKTDALKTELKKYEGETKVLDIAGNKVHIIGEIFQEYEKFIKITYDILPGAYVNKLHQFAKKSPKVNDKYVISRILTDDKKAKLPPDVKEELIYTDEETDKMKDDIHREFYNKYLKDTRAAQQAVISDYCKKTHNVDNSLILYKYLPLDMIQFSQDLEVMSANNKADLEKYYATYSKPLSVSEANKICISMFNTLRQNPKPTTLKIFDINNKSKDILMLLQALHLLITTNDKTTKDLKNEIINFLQKDYDGSARIFLDKEIPNEIKKAKMEDIFVTFLVTHPERCSQILRSNEDVKYMLYNY